MQSAEWKNTWALDCLALPKAHILKNILLFTKVAGFLQYAKSFSNISNAKQDFEGWLLKHMMATLQEIFDLWACDALSLWEPKIANSFENNQNGLKRGLKNYKLQERHENTGFKNELNDHSTIKNDIQVM